MELKKAYTQVMNESVTIALATSVDNKPNVRVVTYAFDESHPNKLYFSTFKGCKKIEEFAQNPQVACLPLPMGPEPGAQVRIFGSVQKSGLSLQQLIDLIRKKSPEDAETLVQGGDMLEIYEVAFSEAWLTIGMTDAQCYTIES